MLSNTDHEVKEHHERSMLRRTAPICRG